MKRLVIAAVAAVGMAGVLGCADDRPPRQQVVVAEPGPVPVEEYYVVGGRYYHWYPHDTRWVEVREVPRGYRAVQVERLPERPVRVVERPAGRRVVVEERR